MSILRCCSTSLRNLVLYNFPDRLHEISNGTMKRDQHWSSGHTWMRLNRPDACCKSGSVVGVGVTWWELTLLTGILVMWIQKWSVAQLYPRFVHALQMTGILSHHWSISCAGATLLLYAPDNAAFPPWAIAKRASCANIGMHAIEKSSSALSHPPSTNYASFHL